MRRLFLLPVLLPALCAVGVGGAWLGSATAADSGVSASAKTFVARPGDQVRLLNSPTACRVVRVRELGRRVAFDCRRGGPLAGTYGTLLTDREAVLVEFQSATEAKIVSTARHHGDAERCG